MIGGGLAGCEAAWQAAERGVKVLLYEMRPHRQTGAHQSGNLAELVCSNSLGSNLVDRASGLLKEELRRLGSLLVRIADETSLPAGAALAVDREQFAQRVTERLTLHPNIHIVREECTSIPETLAVIASGPLTSPDLSEQIQNLTGQEHLFFFDAIAPVVSAESIDLTKAFRASRYERDESGEGDYINCPFNREEYETFVEALTQADRIPLREFEAAIQGGVNAGHFFEGCLPVEILAGRGVKSLAFGPLRPVGLIDPRTGKRPYAVLQLRQDNIAGSLYNLVGFQTNLTYPEQKRVFRLIPGLEKAEFVRFGQMHRNTFIASPRLLHPSLQLKDHPHLLFAGQITGVEGYMGNIATGLLAGLNASRISRGETAVELPVETMAGSLCHYVTHASMKDFQPMKANFGILPALEFLVESKKERAIQYAARSMSALERWISTNQISGNIGNEQA